MTISSSFRISPHRSPGRSDRLLRSAVTAFCSITRPSRRETGQLDDLAVPLLGSVSDETLRFVAASLSESPYAPPTLVRRLCDLPLDVSAPLLMRSPILTSIDLVALIGRHGADHARAIAARNQLDARIARLITAVHDLGPDEAARQLRETHDMPSKQPLVAEIPVEAAPAAPAGEEAVRSSLREMMRPSGQAAPKPGASASLRWEGDPGAYRKLRSTALTGVPALFQTALADALEIDMHRACAIVEGGDVSHLIVALRSLAIEEEQAFFVVQCVWPARFGQVRTISAFVDAFTAVTPQDAERIVAGWRSEDGDLSNDDDHAPAPRQAAANQPSHMERLKAS